MGHWRNHRCRVWFGNLSTIWGNMDSEILESTNYLLGRRVSLFCTQFNSLHIQSSFFPFSCVSLSHFILSVPMFKCWSAWLCTGFAVSMGELDEMCSFTCENMGRCTGSAVSIGELGEMCSFACVNTVRCTGSVVSTGELRETGSFACVKHDKMHGFYSFYRHLRFD